MKKNFTVWIVIGIIVVFVLIIVGYANGVYNKAIDYQEQVDAKWGDVQTAYQRRADLIPSLVATVKGAAANEKDILTTVTNARAGISNAKTPEDMELMGKEINAAINLAFEAYPQIRSTDNFRDLQAQLEGTENRVSVARMKYNEAVQKFNLQIRGKFRKMALRWFESDDDNFVKRELFKADEGSEVAPKVEF
ncbi:MAG: LemA family protein [Bacteroidetes bacterium]|nr:LemA family protein [Bacteroidota bacterium]